MCDLYALGVQIVRAADCNPFVKKGQSPFLTVSLPCFFERSRGGFLTVRLPSKYRPDGKHDARDHGLMHQINKQRLSAAGSQEGDHAPAGVHPGKL